MVAPSAGGSTTQHAVTIHFQYGSTNLSELYALEDRLEQIISATGTGELDGHEIATDGSNGFLYLYGPNADALVEAIRPILEGCQFMGGAEAGYPAHRANTTAIKPYAWSQASG